MWFSFAVGILYFFFSNDTFVYSLILRIFLLYEPLHLVNLLAMENPYYAIGNKFRTEKILNKQLLVLTSVQRLNEHSVM